jgi:hypothetical protein
MAKGLFDHINAITKDQDPKYWDKLDDADKKTWSNWLIIRYMSMNPDWVEMVAEIQPYIQEAPPKAVYKALIGVIPKGKTYLRYMKGKSVKDYEQWIIDLVAKWFMVSIYYMKVLLVEKKLNELPKHTAQIQKKLLS